MIHEIYPEKFDNSFKDIKPESSDFVICFNDKNQILIKRTYNHIELPRFKSIVPAMHIFDISKNRYFYVDYNDIYDLGDEYEFIDIKAFRSLDDKITSYAGVVGKHYSYFLTHAAHCGVCGSPMVPSNIEMANVCPKCNNTKYPDIMPAVAVAIINGDEILLTKYKGNITSPYALVAGYVEIGETLEECVRRETKEEVGLEIKNIRYYASQPWGFSNTIMIGFIAEAITTNIIRDENELSVAEWVKRDDIPLMEAPTSMSHQIIQDFKNKKI